MEEQLELDAKTLQELQADGEALLRLRENPDFERLFVKKFVEAFAITNASNFAYFDRDARTRSLEQIAARGVFVRFQDEILNDANVAKEELASME